MHGDGVLGPFGEVECMAQRQQAQGPFNVLFEPTCSCPRCSPEGRAVEPARQGHAWISERRQRPRVTIVELGPTGRGVLG